MLPLISDLKSESPRRAAGRIALTYAVFGLLWIVLTDLGLSLLVESSARVTYVQTLKGWAFILVTALLVYYLVRGYAMAVQRSGGELQRSEERYRRIVETASEGICIVDTTGLLALVNARFADLVGGSPEELIGQPLLIFVDPESRHELAGRLDANSCGSTHPCDVKLQGSGGQEIWTMAAISPMFNDADCQIGSLLMLTDISERKRLESQLLQLQKMEAVGQLAGGIAHDFNNIVTAILGNVDLMRLQLKRTPIPVESLSSDVDQIERTGERAMALTRQLLTFSRRQVLRTEILEPKRLLADMEKMLSRLIREDIELRLLVADDVAAVRADAGQFEQVIVNLVVNARDAMPSGGKLTIEASTVHLDAHFVATHPDAQEGPHVLITVSDTGHGMDFQTLQRVFEPFFTTKEPGKGTGLGLATVYGIVKQFGGHVNAYSEPNLGSTFRLYLPVAAGVAATKPASTVAEPIRGGHESILVCEDNDAIRQLLCRALKEKGYVVQTCDSPAAALDIFARNDTPLDLLITDLIMAGMSGRELAEHLQSVRLGLKVLYVSGYTSEVVAQHGMLESGVEFLPKPFTSDALLRRVREILDGADVQTETEHRPWRDAPAKDHGNA